MNYPFTKKKTLAGVVSLALVLTSLSGCSLLPSSQGNETIPTEEETVPPTIAVTLPPTEAPTQAPTTAPRKNIAVVKEQLNVRASPSNGARVKCQMEAGDEVEVLRIDYIGEVGWAYISTLATDTVAEGVPGWIQTSLLDLSNVSIASDSTSTPAGNGTVTTPTTPAVTTPTTPAVTTPTTPVNSITGTGTTTTPANAKYGVVTASELNIRSTASQSADRVGSYKYGDRIAVLESSNGWGRTDKGWISLSYVYMDGDVGTNAAYGTVTATQLNVRSGPGTNYERVKSLSQNERVQVLQQIKVGNATWGYVSGGWASMDYIQLDGSTNNNTGNTGNTGSTGTTTYTGVVTGSGVNVRSGAGTSYPVVGSKTMGDVVTITETVSADGMIWGKIDIGWISMNYVRMN